MKISLRVLPLALLLTLAACTNAAEEEPAPNASEDELVNAPRDTKNTWAVGVCNSAPNTDPAKGKLGACVVAGSRCTGSLVAKNLVITARHCVTTIDWTNAAGFCDGKFEPTPSPNTARITLAPSVLQENPTWIKVAEVMTPTGVSACDDDIALLRLEANVADADATPIDVDLRDIARVKEPPGSVAIVGRGVLTSMIDPTTLAPIDEADGGLLRRYAQNIPLRCYSDKAGACSTVDITAPPSNHFTLSKGQFLIGKGGASGDSGSGILAQKSFSGGKPVTFGVFSAGTFGTNGVGNAGIGVRVDRHKGWIVPFAQKAAQAGSYPAPAWAKRSVKSEAGDPTIGNMR